MIYLARLAILSALLVILCLLAACKPPAEATDLDFSNATTKCEPHGGVANIVIYADSNRVECKDGRSFWVPR